MTTATSATTTRAAGHAANINGRGARRRSAEKPNRNIENRTNNRANDWLKIDGILDSPVHWRFAAEIPEQSPMGGRRKLPTIFYVIMPGLADVWRSFDNAEVQLRDPQTWARICQLVCRYQGKYASDDEPFDKKDLVATSPTTAQNFRDARDKWLNPHWDKLRGIFTDEAARVARQVGLCDPDGKGSINDLVRERMLVGDGKVTREYGAAYRPLTDEERATDPEYGKMSHVVDKRTGKILPVGEMGGSANLYKDGAGRIVLGFKNVRISVRDNVHSNSAVILDVAADSNKNEAELAVSMISDAARRLPGILGVVYDTALQGTHINTLARQGLVTVAPITAKSNTGKGRNSSKRVEKTGPLAPQDHRLVDGSICTHQFTHKGGQVYEQKTNAAGAKTSHSLGDPHLELRPDKTAVRLYAAFTVTCDRHTALTGQTYQFQVRWNIAAKPDPGHHGTPVNIAENVRAVPPRGPKYKACYGWRETIENENHQSDLHKYQSRGRAKTAQNMLINEIGFAMVVNGVALKQAQARRATTGQAEHMSGTAAPPGLPAAA